MEEQDIRQIPGHESYGATAHGGVWSRISGAWKPLALSVNGRWGYVKVKLTAGKTYKVHSIIAMTFMGPRPHGMDINHKDGNKQNNTVSNLEYCSRRENVQHARRLGLAKPAYTYCQRTPRLTAITGKQRSMFTGMRTASQRGESVVGCKLSSMAVRQIRERHAGGASLRELGREHGVSATHIRRIVLRIKWSHVE